MDDKIIVSADVLPEVYKKVLLAKELLADGTAQNTSEAIRLTGISRSAFYKYRAHVFRYVPDASGAVINFSAELADKAGVLSALLSRMYGLGANIITVNQSQPVNNVASVSFSVRLNDNITSFSRLKEEIMSINGVKSVHQTI